MAGRQAKGRSRQEQAGSRQAAGRSRQEQAGSRQAAGRQQAGSRQELPEHHSRWPKPSNHLE
jgi:hypothetical protein